MDFFEFAERWATVHPEIQHVAGRRSTNRRFFLTTGFASMVDFLQQNNEAKSSPSIVMESGAPTSGSHEGFDYKDYTIYFCVRATSEMQSNDGAEAKLCKQEAEKLAMEFVNTAVAMNKRWRMERKSIHVEEDYSIEPYGPFHNWWYAAELHLRVGEGHNNCLGEGLADLVAGCGCK